MPQPLTASRQSDRSRLAARALERLARAKQQQDELALRRAVEELVELHLDVARAIAGRYRGRGIATDDLRQVASLALVRAIQEYEPARGTSFLAYAVPVIRGALRHHFRDHGWVVRPPRRVQELQGRLGRECQPIETGGGEPQAARLAEQLGTTTAEVNEALAAEGCFSPLSLDRPAAGDRSDCLADAIVGEPGDGAAEARAMLRSPVRRLDDRDREILGMRFFQELTQQEMAEALGVTQTQVSKILARILRELRSEVGEVHGMPRRGGNASPRVPAAHTA